MKVIISKFVISCKWGVIVSLKFSRQGFYGFTCKVYAKKSQNAGKITNRKSL